ncbi:hypothetical protein HOE31_01445 [bacterium]|jgi:Tfp pilus assembly protein PilN|nr:hypothetical protein [bacterium]MBT4335095.1 hypothetical protein [bacterium]MBT4764091.1 hypothetical protein [bacterium]MBT5401463.1 hypothetical protein [bacterium]MBT5942578.1 hypothetical protein [bacterium]
MIHLNLISPKQQKLLKVRNVYLYIENFLNLLIIASILIAISLIPINQTIANLSRTVEQKKGAVAASNKLLTDKINYLNEEITTIDSIQKSFNDWPGFLKELASLVPNNVLIIQINAQLKTNQFTMQGHAESREEYLLFKDNLENSEIFFDLNTPITDILQRENITFEISGFFNRL